MKKCLIILLTIISCFILTQNVYANPYKKTFKFNGNELTNCTWFAWQKAHDKAGVSLPGWGNASTWYESARKAGFEVGNTPRAKSIVVWSWYNNGKNLGHVGYVERVSGNKIYVWDSDSTCYDQNYAPFKECLANSVSEDTERECYKYAKTTACEENASYWSSPGDLIGYIYLDNIPATTKKITSRKITTSTTKKIIEEITTTEIAITPYLKNLETNIGNIKFDKDIFSYEINIYSEDNYIFISAINDDNDFTIEGDGKRDLIVGKNEYSIKVRSSEGNETVYKITVNNKEEFKPEVTTTINKAKNYLMPIDIMFGVVVGITIFIFSYGIYRRKC